MAGAWSKPLVAVFLVFFALMGFRSFVAEPLTVNSVSMFPSLTDGDVIVVDKISPLFTGIKPGDIVMVSSKTGEQIVKRVSAVGGQSVQIYDSKVLIGDKEALEPYVKAYNPGGLFFPITNVPEGEVFLLGDNRLKSVDSRTFGTVPLSSIVGRVSVVLPLGNHSAAVAFE